VIKYHKANCRIIGNKYYIHFYFTKNKDNKLLQKLFNKKKIRVPVRSTLHRILSKRHILNVVSNRNI